MIQSVLVLANRYPPANSSGVFRTLFFFNHIAARGNYKTHIVTLDVPSYLQGQTIDEKLLEQVSDLITIERTKSWNVRESVIVFKRWLRPNSSLQKEVKHEKINKNDNKKISFFRAIKDVFTDEVLSFPDQDIGWLPFAYNKGVKVVRQNNIKLVYSSGGPWTSHIAAYLISKRTGIRFVLDYRDPWYGNPFHAKKSKTFKHISLLLEKKIIKKAARVICNTNNLKEFYVEKFGFEEKFVVITNGWEKTYKTQKTGTNTKGCLVISHAGSLYGNRSPNNFIKAVINLISKKKIAKIQVQLIGAEDSVNKYIADEFGPEWLKDIFMVIPRVQHDVCLDYLMHSDVLLLFQQGTKLQVPRKLYEYIAMQLPILAICDEGETKDLVKNNGFGIAASDEIVEIESAILQLTTSYDFTVNADSLINYDNKKLSLDLENVFSSVLLQCQMKENV